MIDQKILNITAYETTLTSPQCPYSTPTDTVAFIHAVFNLTGSWNNFDSVRAVWFNDNQCISTLLTAGECDVPQEVLQTKSKVRVNLVGSNIENNEVVDRLTTYPLFAVNNNYEARTCGTETAPVTPSQFEQFIEVVKTDAESASASAQSASESAESAHNDKVEIEQAIAEVIQQIEDFEQVQVVVNTLPPTSPATSDFTDGVLTLGIPQGVKGDTGNGIQSIEKISTSGLVDTYRITYTNGQTTTFTVTNGAKGDTGNGIQSIEKTSTQGLVDTYTITYTDGNTSTFTVTNGEKGEQGEVSLDELLQNTIIQTNADTEPYSFRATPQCGSLEYDTLIGGTVAWNQLIPSSLLSGGSSKGITITTDGNGGITVNGTATESGSILLSSAFTVVPTHIYLNKGYVKVGTNSGDISFGGQAKDMGNGVLWKDASYTTTRLRFDFASGDSFSNTKMYPNVIDLTLAFGSTIADYVYSLEQATAGSGIAWLKSYGFLGKSYYPYDSGSLLSVKTSGHKVVGFNQWDEEWESGGINDTTGEKISVSSQYRSKNFIPCVPNISYYICYSGTATGAVYIYYYGQDKTFIGRATNGGNNVANKTITTPSDCHYMMMKAQITGSTTYANDICINISDSTKNGTYEPYVSQTYELDNIDLRGILKLDNGSLYYDGDTYESDGSVTRKYGVFEITNSTNIQVTSNYSNITYAKISKPSGALDEGKATTNCIHTSYPINTATSNWDDASKVGYLFGGADTANYWFGFPYGTTQPQMQSKLAGTQIIYELATPTTESADPYTSPQTVYDGGTEEYVDDRAVPMPVGHSTEYPMTLIDTMPTANGTYTMSVTVANGKRTITWT